MVRTYHAYPVYDLDYSRKIKVITEYLDKFDGLYISGRGGTFRYNNADHSIEMGLMLGQRLLGYDIDHMSVNTEESYQEIITGDEPERDKFTLGSAADEGATANASTQKSDA